MSNTQAQLRLREKTFQSSSNKIMFRAGKLCENSLSLYSETTLPPPPPQHLDVALSKTKYSVYKFMA